MMDDELKPCPFCGFRQEIGEVSFATTHAGKGSYAVCCDRCEAIGPMRHTTDMAIFAWNERFDGESNG
ncbi:Lar family restriction alleviation protein [Citrobacter sedlakii]|uniref:Lar family restriction alleviation protein n=1 Tax=Citrobacter sedlakii TaxID=67826 RepID=UPI0033392AB4